MVVRMTSEQLGHMALADAEALASRLESAARTIRDAMALLGGGPMLTPAHAASPLGLPTTPAITWIPDAVRMTNKGPLVLTPEERARKAAMRAERLAELPDNIRAIEEQHQEDA